MRISQGVRNGMLVFVAGMMLVTATATAAQATNVEPIAHRGFHNAKYDENTLAGFKRAAQIGAYIETDIQTTKDLKFVLVHDETLGYTTNCDSDVMDMTLEEIEDQCRTEGQQQLVPTFRQLAHFLGNHKGTIANAEIKNATDSTSWTDNDNRLLRKLVAIARHEGARDQVYFSDDDGAELRKALRASAPKALTCWKPDTDETFTPSRAKRLSVDAVMAYDEFWKSGDNVSAFKRKGILAWGRIANTADQWKRYKQLGVDRVLTDNPAAKWFDSH